MKIEQIYTNCLSHGAYYILSEGEAAIIDPLRDTKPYLDRLAKDGASLKFIFETHFHADFVSGHIDLARETGASIVYGPTAKPSFEAVVAADNQIFRLGSVTIRVIHTPGHTMESSCFLLSDENGKESVLFSGDTLFLGDVGRPDLAQKAANLTREELAGLLYESLYNKILPLADDIIVYPAHGAGSACGKKMMTETSDTLGHQKQVNYALNQPDKSSFIKAVTDGLLPPPAYFGANAAMNKAGYESFDRVLKHGLNALDPATFALIAEKDGSLVLDTRSSGDFAKGHIPHSINIGLNGDFAPWAGALIVDLQQSILIVADEGKEEETITRLSRVGFDHVAGFLSGGFAAWKNAGRDVDVVHRITAQQFAAAYKHGTSRVIDVRTADEYAAAHVDDAENHPLAYINDWISDINPGAHFYLHCAGGYRSMIAASILQARGYRNFCEIEGGFSAIKTTAVPTTDRGSITRPKDEVVAASVKPVFYATGVPNG